MGLGLSLGLCLCLCGGLCWGLCVISGGVGLAEGIVIIITIFGRFGLVVAGVTEARVILAIIWLGGKRIPRDNGGSKNNRQKGKKK